MSDSETLPTSGDATPDAAPNETPDAGSVPPTGRRGIMRRTYDWMLELSRRPNAERALFLLAFAESMFFPIPPDVMLIPMCVARPGKALRFALICSIASLLGGMAGYAIGHFFWQGVDQIFFQYVPGFTPELFERVGEKYEQYNFWVVFTAGFTPLPYKIITISAGVFQVNFLMFVIASAVSRSARFFLVAAILKRWGPPAQELIEKHFNLVATAFVVLLIGGFWVLSQL